MAADTADRVKRITIQVLKFGAATPGPANDNNYSDAQLTATIQEIWALTFKPVFLAKGWDVGTIDYPSTEISSSTAEKIEINGAVARIVAYELMADPMSDVDYTLYGPGSEVWKNRRRSLTWLATVENGKRCFTGIARVTGTLPSGPILSNPPRLFEDRDNGEGGKSKESEWPLL